MMLSFFLTYSSIIALLFLCSIPVVTSAYGAIPLGSFVLFSLLMFLLCVTCIFLGVLLATLCDSFTLANVIMVGSIISLSLFGGGFHPIEKCREFYQITSKVLPLYFPSQAIRNILVKGYGFEHRSVQLGFGIAILWSIIAITVSLLILKHRRFSRNT